MPQQKPRSKYAMPVVVGAILILATAPPASAASADVDGIVAAYGGPTALEKIRAYRVTAETEALLRGGKQGTVVRDFRAPGNLRVTIEYPDGLEVRILDGDRGWRGTKGSVVPAEGMLLDSMIYQLLRSDLPGVLARHRDRLVDGGLARDADGGEYPVLVLPFSDTLDVRYWIDPGSLRVARVQGSLRTAHGTMTFETEYADYREIDGVWIPFGEINHANDRKVAETRVTGIVWDPVDLGPFNAD